MGAKISAALLTLLIDLVAGVVVFFFMLIAMNGFSESDAGYGLIAYIVVGIGAAILTSIGAWAMTALLIRREMKAAIAAMVSLVVFSILGIVALIVASLIGVGVAEYVRVNY